MRQYPDLVGQRFGMLVVIEQAASSATGKRRWVCRCDCGKEHTVIGSNLTQGTTLSCGCKRYNNLEGQKIGMLTVIGRSEKYGSRGKRKTQLWECLCDCGAITYKATDTLTNPDVSMCQACAKKYATSRARASAGYLEGTQISKIAGFDQASNNATGVRGVYYDGKTGRYRARITFKGKRYDLGSFLLKEDAIKARQEGERAFFDSFLESVGSIK